VRESPHKRNVGENLRLYRGKKSQQEPIPASKVAHQKKKRGGGDLRSREKKKKKRRQGTEGKLQRPCSHPHEKKKSRLDGKGEKEEQGGVGEKEEQKRGLAEVHEKDICRIPERVSERNAEAEARNAGSKLQGWKGAPHEGGRRTQ